MSAFPPPPPKSFPENVPLRADSRYLDKPKGLAWWAVLLGAIIGLGLGLFYAWQLDPKKEVDTRPHQLRPTDKAYYVVAIALRFSNDSNLSQAVESLIELNLGSDPFQSVAETACDLARTGYVDSSAGIRAIRALQTFYRLQGKSGCADVLIVDTQTETLVEVIVPTATATLAPPPSKTPDILPSPTPAGIVIVPTTPPTQKYSGRIVNTFCSTELSGIIEVFVQNNAGDGIPAQRVRVRWDGGEDRFVTGLKPERGKGYADFTMEAGKGYTIDMPTQSDPLNTPIVADRCITETGAEAITSYRVVFRPSN